MVILKNNIKLINVSDDYSGMRFDKWFKLIYPYVPYSLLNKILRSGQIRINSKRIKNYTKLEKGQQIRVPSLNYINKNFNIKKKDNFINYYYKKYNNFLQSILLYKDERIFIFNKPSGLPVQGGSGIIHSLDKMLEVWKNNKGEKPKLVHRIDKDTSGILVVARTKNIAKDLSLLFSSRSIKKLYWALVSGITPQKEDIIYNWLSKKSNINDKIYICNNNQNSDFAISHYKFLNNLSNKISFLSIIPYTGRTHQLRVQMAYIGNPILGDKKYFNLKDNKYAILPLKIHRYLYLHARRILIPMLCGNSIDIVAPIPKYWSCALEFLKFDIKDEYSYL